VIVTNATRTGDAPADGSYLTRRLAPAGTTPPACRQTRIAQLVNDLDPSSPLPRSACAKAASSATWPTTSAATASSAPAPADQPGHSRWRLAHVPANLCELDKEGAEPNFKGFGHHPLAAGCDNTAEPLAWMLRPGSAGSNTAADHLRLLGEAIAALPPRHRRKLMITCDGTGASHDLVTELDRLAARPGY